MSVLINGASGTGKTHFLHAIGYALSNKYGQEFADATRILYGGSVKDSNVDEIMAQADVDGALVGGQALIAEKFTRIINFN